MYEKMEQFLAKQYDMVIKADTHADKKTFFDQAFGGLSFAIQMCGADWDEANRYVDLWSKVWYKKFVKAVYDYDAEV
jgi:hypothetical protein